MNEVDKVQLLELARDAISSKFTEEEVDTSDVAHLKEEKGVFVKLMKHRHFRAGTGILKSNKPLYKTVVEVSKKAAFDDPRFSKVEEKELASINIEISVVHELEQLRGNPDSYDDQVEIGEHGLLMKGNSRALILPEVAKNKMYTPIQFLNALAQKAGLSFNAWQDENNRIYKFKTTRFSE